MLAARLLSYGVEPILIGAADAIPPTPTDTEWIRAVTAVEAGIRRAPKARGVLDDLLLVGAEYLAGQRSFASGGDESRTRKP